MIKGGLDKLTSRLVLTNLLSFLIVLAVFSLTVFTFIRSRSDGENRASLAKLADAVIASIDFDDNDTSIPGTPDLIASVMPAESSDSLQKLCLEWYDTSAHLRMKKGSLTLLAPFTPTSGYGEQAHPHALYLTKEARINGKIIGYTRVGQPLVETDRNLKDLATGLTVGSAVALLCSGLLVMVLVNQSLQPVRKNMARLRQFTADASHELRGPITAIATNSNVALKYDEGMRAKDREKMQAIASAARQMEKLVGDLLILAGADEEQDEVDKQKANIECDLSSLLLKLIEAYRPLAEAKQIKLTTELSPAVKAISVRLQDSNGADDLDRLFGNLLQNAINYTPELGSISVGLNHKDGMITVDITDTGIGINKESQDKIFDRFWRADQARNYREGGNGLGLSIALALVRRHNGAIKVTSPVEDARGSRFTVYLPASSS
jgi:two-component system, OmpR family, manganese sensing sensor histidine kinase